MQTYQHINFKQDIYEGKTADVDDDNYEPEPGLYYNYSTTEDQYFSIVRDKDMDSIIAQLKEGKKVDANFPFRMTEHETDIELLKVAIEHTSYVRDSDDDWFCVGVWHQKFDFDNHEAAKLLLELYFRAGGTVEQFQTQAGDILCIEEGDENDIEMGQWLEEEYREFVTKYGLLKWKVSGTDNNFEADAPTPSMIGLICNALRNITGHGYMEVWEDKDGYRIHFQECEGWPKASERWDWSRHTDGKSLADVCEVFDDLLDYAYGGGEKFSIEAV